MHMNTGIKVLIDADNQPLSEYQKNSSHTLTILLLQNLSTMKVFKDH